MASSCHRRCRKTGSLFHLLIAFLLFVFFSFCCCCCCRPGEREREENSFSFLVYSYFWGFAAQLSSAHIRNIPILKNTKITSECLHTTHYATQAPSDKIITKLFLDSNRKGKTKKHISLIWIPRIAIVMSEWLNVAWNATLSRARRVPCACWILLQNKMISSI